MDLRLESPSSFQNPARAFSLFQFDRKPVSDLVDFASKGILQGHFLF